MKVLDEIWKRFWMRMKYQFDIKILEEQRAIHVVLLMCIWGGLQIRNHTKHGKLFFLQLHCTKLIIASVIDKGFRGKPRKFVSNLIVISD